MKNENKNKIGVHPELDSGSPSYLFNKENNLINNNGEAGDPECPQGGPNFITATKAFTLIELLVVVLIIGILPAVAVPQYQKAVDKTRFVQVMTAGDALRTAEKVYHLANGKYTKQLNELDISIPGEVSVNGNEVNFNGGTCYISYGSQGSLDSILCATASYNKLWFRVWLDENLTRYCVAADGDERATRICKTITQAPGIARGSHVHYAL